MSQQINLFDARFRRQRRHFSAATMLVALVAVALLSFAVEELYASKNRALQATLARADQRATELREQTVRFAKDSSDQGGRSDALGEEIARVEEQLRVRRALLAGMQSGVGGNVEGFSPYLSALARQTTQGLWLTGVEIGPQSGDLVLKGRALDSGLVPAYIRQLNEEQLFKGRTVTELRLSTKNEAAKRYVEFSLQIPLGKGAS
jgi:Tfp pilus assembly protein PilN